MKNFAIGCNYWASNAGMYMWKNFDREIVEKDLALLSSYGVDTIRVFPLWSDFQPVSKMFVSNKVFTERVGDTPIKTYGGLDQKQMDNFSALLDVAEKYGLKVIVALITGWMSGRLFYPEILTNENPLTSPKAIVWETRFISEFVPYFKGRKCIVAWEPGNECNVLDGTLPACGVTPEQAELWLMTITNAIRAADNTRPVYAGMHGLGFGGAWDLKMVAHYTDMQTTHPYPLFTEYCDIEAITSMRPALHAAAESVFYSSSTDRPCLVEEVGTLGPMVISDDYSPEYLEKSLFSSFQYGTSGYLWWCAFDQDKFDFAPYDCSGLERNLGLIYGDFKPKPVLKEMSKMHEVIREIGELPPYERDIEVILVNDREEWKNAYGAFCLAAQAGLSVGFSHKSDVFKRAKNYIIPCVSSDVNYKFLPSLLKEVENGANLLISYDGGHLGSFERLTGLKVKGREGVKKRKDFSVGESRLSADVSADLILVADKAQVLIGSEGNIVLSINQVGKGSVYFLNCALENTYTQTYNSQDLGLHKVYDTVFGSMVKPIRLKSDKCAVTYHKISGEGTLVLITKFEDADKIEFDLNDGYRIAGVKYCSIEGKTILFSENYCCLQLEKI